MTVQVGLPGVGDVVAQREVVLAEGLGDGHPVRQTSAAGARFGITTDADLADYDLDGDLDLILGRYGEPHQLLRNNDVP